MKMTEDIEKATLPAKKDVYRLFLQSGQPYVDLMVVAGSPAPQAGNVFTCIHPHNELKRVMIKPAKVEKLHKEWIANGKLLYPHTEVDGKIVLQHPSVEDVRMATLEQICHLREDHKRYLNPTPYKVSVDENLKNLIRELALGCASVPLVQ